MVFHVFPSRTPVPNREINKPTRGYYARSVLTDAIRAVMQNRMSIAKAADFHKIPRPTLQRKVAQVRKEHRKAESHKQMMAKRAEGGDKAAPSTSTQQPPVTATKPAAAARTNLPPVYIEQDPSMESCSTDFGHAQQPYTYLRVDPNTIDDHYHQKQTFILSKMEMQDVVRELNDHLPQSQHISMNIGRLLCNDGYGRVVKEYVLRDDVDDDEEEISISVVGEVGEEEELERLEGRGSSDVEAYETIEEDHIDVSNL